MRGFDDTQHPILAQNVSMESINDNRAVSSKPSTLRRDFLKNTKECRKNQLAAGQKRFPNKLRHGNRGYSEFEMQQNAGKMHSVSPTNHKKKLELINSSKSIIVQ